ncbi:hypothetical protein PGTUg99_020906 [Puccinia graminis f. sp. tritici]|uniref:Uncharacterized protein n=1 Tax=Puccinia graminis f. sp. tritici TaxID=56615 RepID=A0A5B0PPL4_PUCGR|nr:hypothetical protein PGTUg99_020906 [Puccinia graminis f. sp. tritici]
MFILSTKAIPAPRKLLSQIILLGLIARKICATFPKILAPDFDEFLTSRGHASAQVEESRKLSMTEIVQGINGYPRTSQHDAAPNQVTAADERQTNVILGQLGTKRKAPMLDFPEGEGFSDEHPPNSEHSNGHDQVRSTDPTQKSKSGPEGGSTSYSPIDPVTGLGTSTDLPNSKIRQDFEDRVMRPLYECDVDSLALGLTDEAAENFGILARDLVNQFGRIVDGLPTPAVNHQPGPLNLELSLAPAQPFPKNFDRVGGRISRRMSGFWHLLQNNDHFHPDISEPIPSQQTGRKINRWVMMFRLNDIWVEFLAISAQHDLLSRNLLHSFLNDVNAEHGISNWVMGKFLPFFDITTTYLSYDLKLALEESRFTADIHSLLKHLNPSTWQAVVRTILIAQIKTVSYNHEKQPRINELLELLIKFEKATPLDRKTPYKSVHDSRVIAFVTSLINHIMETPEAKRRRHAGNGVLDQFEVLRHYYLNNMSRYMLQYHIRDVSDENMAKLREKSVYPQLQAYDEAAMLYSDALNSAYAKYGELLQKLPEIELDEKRTELPGFRLIYLTNRSQRNHASIFSLGRDEELPVKYDQPIPTEGFIGIEKPNYRLRHLLDRDRNSYPVWRKIMDENHRESKPLHPMPSTISFLEEESRQIRFTLQEILPRLPLAEQISKLEEMLKYPFYEDYR